MSLWRSLVAIAGPAFIAIELREHEIMARRIGMAPFRQAIIVFTESREYLFVKTFYMGQDIRRLALGEFLQERLVPRRERPVLAERVKAAQIFPLVKRGGAPLHKGKYGNRLHEGTGAQHGAKHGPAVPI